MAFKDPKEMGNLVGAAIFVAGAYWYLYAKPDPEEKSEPAGETPQEKRAGAPAAART